MNNETNKLFIKNVGITNINEEEIVLAPPTELFKEAERIAETTQEEEKFTFFLKYDLNEKDFLKSLIEKAGANVESVDGDTLKVLMNMSQLALIKSLDCVERVKDDESANRRIVENVKKSYINQQINEKNTEFTKVELLTADETKMVSAEAVATANEVSTTSACGCTTNTSIQTAQEINIETIVGGSICCPGAEQWFKFTVPERETYTIYTTGELDTVGALYDWEGSLMVEVDDHAACGKLNFRIIRHLGEGTYYVRVTEAKGNTGNYFLKITQKRLVDYVSVNPPMIMLEIGKTYELAVTPDTFVNIDGAEQISDLSATVFPTTADEKKVLWYSFDTDVIQVSGGWHDGQPYATLTVVGEGAATLYAYDWNENGKKGECIIYVPKVTVISCSDESWIESSETMGDNMATAFNCEGSYFVETPTSAIAFENCWNKSNECMVIHTHGGPDNLCDEVGDSTPIIISKTEINDLPKNNKIHFIMITACETAGGTTNDNVACALSKRINPDGIVIANTDEVSGDDTEFLGSNENATWKVYKNGILQAPISDITLTMQSAYNIYQSYKSG